MKRLSTLAFLLLVLIQARASEVFIRINAPGTFEVTVGDQFQKNSTGKFRFFDLNSGFLSIKVKQSGSYTSFYQGSVNVHSGKRMVVEISQNNIYESSHDHCSNNYDFPSGNSGGYSGGGGHHNNHNHHNHHNNGHYNNGCDENSFSEMFAMLKDESFDSRLLEKAKVYTAKAHFSSAQVKRICELFTYDSNRLEYAKYAYDHVVDRGSYFIVEQTFTYNSNKQELEQYISTH